MIEVVVIEVVVVEVVKGADVRSPRAKLNALGSATPSASTKLFPAGYATWNSLNSSLSAKR